MFPSTKLSLQKETMGRYSNTVIGILLFVLVITMGLFVLGVWVNAADGTTNDKFALPYTPEKNPLNELTSQDLPSEIKQSDGLSSEVMEEAFSGLCDGPVPESDCLGCVDTVAGTLTVIEDNLPTEALPLCIDNDYLKPFYVLVESVGGYSPEWGQVYLNQLKEDGPFDGILIAHFDRICVPGCPCAVQYNITFTTFMNRPICLESNHLPNGMDPDRTLGKEVCVSYSSQWKGCGLQNQKFMVILAHKTMSQNPELPILKTSPVLN
jgi:hypothetical protein